MLYICVCLTCVVIDEKGVGQLIKMSLESGRKGHSLEGRKKFKAGVCGEHGGNPTSVRFFVRSGMNYVSCSPLRVPIARLAAAQCVVEDEANPELAGARIKMKEQAPDDVPERVWMDDDEYKQFIITHVYSPRRA